MSCTVLSPRDAVVNKADKFFVFMEYTCYWEWTDHKQINKQTVSGDDKCYDENKRVQW